LRVLVCGGRDFNNYPLLRKTLRGLFPPSTDDMSTWMLPSDTVIIHGDAPGADSLADQWAVVNWVQVERYPADSRMINEGKPDLVVAFAGGRGTADCVRQARAVGVRVIEVN